MLSEKKLNNLVSTMIMEYNISILFVNHDKIRSNAIIIKYKGKFTMYISKEIPSNLILFVFLHEISHIKLNIFHNRPTNIIWEEKLVNIKALGILKPYISLKVYLNYLIRAVYSEKALITYFVKKNKIIPEVFLWKKES